MKSLNKKRFCFRHYPVSYTITSYGWKVANIAVNVIWFLIVVGVMSALAMMLVESVTKGGKL